MEGGRGGGGGAVRYVICLVAQPATSEERGSDAIGFRDQNNDIGRGCSPVACLLLTNTATLPVSKGHSRASCPPRDVFGADVAVKKVTATLPGNRGGELSVCFPGGEDGRRGHTHTPTRSSLNRGGNALALPTTARPRMTFPISKKIRSDRSADVCTSIFLLLCILLSPGLGLYVGREECLRSSMAQKVGDSSGVFGLLTCY